ncbi:STAS domain-containing protein [Sphaerisporangium fuscum]|uniref:STAS domain-containing protein n=1 Tax=Sphaerisporangium fuscum TaxID=2835868 RepID=UPI001BDDAE3D|nr:STAS domain-containing protein [Sphaerisporangium fuscum]
MTSPLSLAASRRIDGRPVLVVTGEIDMSNADAFDAALTRSAADGDRLVVDLGAVGYLDSAGLAVLFAHGARIELIVNPVLAPVVTFSGLPEVVPVHGPAPGADSV